jgi:hypothetical protein
MPYLIKKFKDGYKVCKRDNIKKCFSNNPIPLENAKKQLKAIGMHSGGSKSPIEKNTIYLDCNKDDDCKILTIRGESEKDLNELLSIFEKEFNKKFNVEYRYFKKRENPLKDCDWFYMPEYKVNPALFKYPFFYIFYNEDNKNILNTFKKIEDKINIKLNKDTKFIWYKKRPDDLSPNQNMMYDETEHIKPKYPIYIISKGRWEKRLTSKYLEWANIDYKIVVEPQEFDNYNKYIDKSKILILPKKYLNKNQGGIPARNFVLEHSKKNKDLRHWILDDNIDGYCRVNDSERTLCKSGAVFRVIEDYVDRYENIKMAGHNYSMFAVPMSMLKPIILNTRIYSSILLSNDIPFEWRGRYNEDTDLSLRILKKGFATVLFNAFTANKLMTLTQKGGNTDTIYSVKDALYLKAKSLQEQHPDVAIVKKRFNRIHHFVDYTPFKDNKPIMKKNIKIPKGNNNYGLKLVKKIKYKGGNKAYDYDIPYKDINELDSNYLLDIPFKKTGYGVGQSRCSDINVAEDNRIRRPVLNPFDIPPDDFTSETTTTEPSTSLSTSFLPPALLDSYCSNINVAENNRPYTHRPGLNPFNIPPDDVISITSDGSTIPVVQTTTSNPSTSLSSFGFSDGFQDDGDIPLHRDEAIIFNNLEGRNYNLMEMHTKYEDLKDVKLKNLDLVNKKLKETLSVGHRLQLTQIKKNIIDDIDKIDIKLVDMIKEFNENEIRKAETYKNVMRYMRRR